jgi:Uma2 family endonuclease
MAIRIDGTHLTYDDFLKLPDDGKRYEIIDGELHVSPAPTFRHQRVAARARGPERLAVRQTHRLDADE